MTVQLALVHESLADALREVVQALGGSKRVGQMLRPAKTADEGARWVLDCLNADRREHFSPEDVLLLLREGRRVGAHAGMTFMARDAGYAPPTPLDPADEAAQLQRAFIESVQSQQRMVERLATLGVVPMPREAFRG